MRRVIRFAGPFRRSAFVGLRTGFFGFFVGAFVRVVCCGDPARAVGVVFADLTATLLDG